MTPRALAQKLEAERSLPTGSEERFNGFGVMGLPFSSGHVLALRRFPASSVGAGYTSVWHRLPNQSWSFYADTDPHYSCTRYFGKKAAHTYKTPVILNWQDDYSFEVNIESVGLTWFVNVQATPVTIAMNALGSLLPAQAWKSDSILKLMGKVAGTVLGLQKVNLTGTVPNGQHFKANPKIMWAIKESHATIAGHDLGVPAILPQQTHLQDFWIPQHGLLVFGQAYFTPFDPLKHSAAISSTDQ
ncbi:hypothetical protein [Adhaeribacter terreus]|uniref:Uncharacterized protein n=1 Tax=Adhaeribacter terreus TaxID=529703 RepID=A0ABW0E661_9BACT